MKRRKNRNVSLPWNPRCKQTSRPRNDISAPTDNFFERAGDAAAGTKQFAKHVALISTAAG